MQRNEATGVIAIAFECNTVEEQEVVDAVRTAMMGDFTKRGGYINSNRWVVHVHTNEQSKDKQ